MVIKPSNGSDGVVYCRGSEVQICSRSDWDRLATGADPILVLNRAESLVLERFLRYWLQDREEGPIYGECGVDVVYDF